MIIKRVSPISGKENTMDLDITTAQIEAYQAGALIQDAFSNLDAGQREFLMTGITPEEWDGIFGKEEA